jgi:hypothetical protein
LREQLDQRHEFDELRSTPIFSLGSPNQTDERPRQVSQDRWISGIREVREDREDSCDTGRRGDPVDLVARDRTR